MNGTAESDCPQLGTHEKRKPQDDLWRSSEQGSIYHILLPAQNNIFYRSYREICIVRCLRRIQSFRTLSAGDNYPGTEINQRKAM
jgi:hypothetical protein